MYFNDAVAVKTALNYRLKLLLMNELYWRCLNNFDNQDDDLVLTRECDS